MSRSTGCTRATSKGLQKVEMCIPIGVRSGGLNGSRQYDYKDVIGRVESGTETEKTSGSAKLTLGSKFSNRT